MIKQVFVRRNLPEIKEMLRACPFEVRTYVDYLEGHKENAFKLADRVKKLIRDNDSLRNQVDSLTLENQSLKRQLSGFDDSDDNPF